MPVVRPATVEDLHDLLALWLELEEAQGAFRIFPPVSDAADRITRSFGDAIASADADVLVAVAGSEVLGMALVHMEHPSRMSAERTVELSRVVVRRDHRRSGIGELLIEAAAAWARDRGIRTLVAAVFIGNEASKRFWEDRGFVPWVVRTVKTLEG